MKRWIDFLSKRILEPTDVASVVVFRVGFGLLMFWEFTRYYYNGWVEEFYVKPNFHFKYKWFQCLVAINHFPNFSEEWLRAGSPVEPVEPIIRDKSPYVFKSGQFDAFDDDLAEFTNLDEYADGKSISPKPKFQKKNGNKNRAPTAA